MGVIWWGNRSDDHPCEGSNENEIDGIQNRVSKLLQGNIIIALTVKSIILIIVVINCELVLFYNIFHLRSYNRVNQLKSALVCWLVVNS